MNLYSVWIYTYERSPYDVTYQPFLPPHHQQQKLTLNSNEIHADFLTFFVDQYCTFFNDESFHFVVVTILILSNTFRFFCSVLPRILYIFRFEVAIVYNFHNRNEHLTVRTSGYTNFGFVLLKNLNPTILR